MQSVAPRLKEGTMAEPLLNDDDDLIYENVTNSGSKVLLHTTPRNGVDERGLDRVKTNVRMEGVSGSLTSEREMSVRTEDIFMEYKHSEDGMETSRGPSTTGATPVDTDKDNYALPSHSNDGYGLLSHARVSDDGYALPAGHELNTSIVSDDGMLSPPMSAYSGSQVMASDVLRLKDERSKDSAVDEAAKIPFDV